MTATVTAVSETQSLAAIRNFVRASVSAIAYARGFCEDDSFEQRSFLGIPLKHMLPLRPEAVTISSWIEQGAFDALNRQYLKEMALCVYSDSCTELVESFTFSFAYSGQRATMSVDATQRESLMGATQCSDRPEKRRYTSKEDAQRMLAAILTKLVDVMEQLPPLLNQRILAMRLTYYEDRTPPDYEPPLFKRASQHIERLYREEPQHCLSMGSMRTSHHCFSVSICNRVLATARSSLQDTESCKHHNTLEQSFSITKTVDASQSSRAQKATNPCKSATSSLKKAVCPMLQPDDVRALPPLLRLLESASPLRVKEVHYLLLVAFVVSRSSVSGSDAGRLRVSEVEHFLRYTSPVEMSMEAAHAVLRRLVEEKVLKLNIPTRSGMEEAARPTTTTSNPFMGGAAGERSEREWIVLGSQPEGIPRGLLGREQVLHLLPPAHVAALTKLAQRKCRHSKRQRTYVL